MGEKSPGSGLVADQSLQIVYADDFQEQQTESCSAATARSRVDYGTGSGVAHLSAHHLWIG